MLNRPYLTIVVLTALGLLPAAPVFAQGEIVITQAKANAGGITPGDTAGFPVTLSLPGAYILASNLTVPANKTGIVVTTFNVDIDMNGFRLDGANATGTKVANHGVHGLSLGISRIHDGVITRFKFNGIVLASNSNSWVVEDMQILANNGNGIFALDTAYSRFLRNSILVNGANGIVCGGFCHIEGNNVSDNGLIGIQLRSGTVLGNTIISNGTFGLCKFGGWRGRWLWQQHNNFERQRSDRWASGRHPSQFCKALVGRDVARRRRITPILVAGEPPGTATSVSV